MIKWKLLHATDRAAWILRAVDMETTCIIKVYVSYNDNLKFSLNTTRRIRRLIANRLKQEHKIVRTREELRLINIGLLTPLPIKGY